MCARTSSEFPKIGDLNIVPLKNRILTIRTQNKVPLIVGNSQLRPFSRTATSSSRAGRLWRSFLLPTTAASSTMPVSSPWLDGWSLGVSSCFDSKRLLEGIGDFCDSLKKASCTWLYRACALDVQSAGVTGQTATGPKKTDVSITLQSPEPFVSQPAVHRGALMSIDEDLRISFYVLKPERWNGDFRK